MSNTSTYIHHKLHKHIHLAIIDKLLKVTSHQHFHVSITLRVGLLRAHKRLQLLTEELLNVVTDGLLFKHSLEGVLRDFVITVAGNAEAGKGVLVNTEEIQHILLTVVEVHNEETSLVVQSNLLEHRLDVGVLFQEVLGGEENQLREDFRLAREHDLHVAVLVGDNERERLDG